MRLPHSVPATPLVLLALLSGTPSAGGPRRAQEDVPATAAAQAGTLEGGRQELPATRLKRLLREKQLADLNGAWQLRAFLVDGIPVPSDEIAGNAVFCDGFMSLTIHAVGYDADTGEEAAIAQAGIFRFSVDDDSALRTLTVIGHSTPQGNVRYETVGGLRQYTLRIDTNRVDLRHHTGTELSFIRMPPVGLSGQEIARLGRALPPSGTDDAPGLPGREPQSEDEVIADDVRSEVVRSEDVLPEQGALNPLFQHQRGKRAVLAEQMAGPWFLAGYMVEGVPLSDDEIRGAALLCDGYMSLVLHALEYADEIGEEIQFAQAGIFRYRLTGSSMLQTSTVIGHSNPIDGVDYEAAGGLRQYDASMVDGALILRGFNGTALRFVRMNPREFTDYETQLFNRYGRGTDLVDDEDDE